MVDPLEKNLLATRDPYQNFGINNIRVDGEIEILKSDAVVLRAVEKAGLLDDVEFGINAEDANVGEVVDGDFLLKRVILSLQGAISVSRTEGTYLITAKVSSTDPKRAAELTNILAEAYIEHQISTKVESIEQVRDILQLRLEEARLALEQSETSFDGFIFENLDVIEAQTGRSDLSVLRAVTTAIDAQTVQKNLLAQSLTRDIQQGNWAQIANDLQSEAIVEFERQRLEIESKLETAVSGSQTSIDLRRELKDIDKSLNEEASRSLTGYVARFPACKHRQTKPGHKLGNRFLRAIYHPSCLQKFMLCNRIQT